MSRHNKRWNVNEELKLQREYELLNMTIQEIAESHERTEEAILCKLQKEGFIRSWYEATGYKEYEKSLPDFINLSYYQIVSETTSEEEEDSVNNNGDQRLWTIINEIKNMVSALLYKRECSTARSIIS
jgi:hypothetical protein